MFRAYCGGTRYLDDRLVGRLAREARFDRGRCAFDEREASKRAGASLPEAVQTVLDARLAADQVPARSDVPG